MSLSSIMRRAWQLYHCAHCKYRAEFAEALRAAWAEAKAFAETVSNMVRRGVLYINASGRLTGVRSYGVTGSDMTWIKNNFKAIVEHMRNNAEAKSRFMRRAG